MFHSAPDRRLPSITAAQRGLSGNATGAVASYVTLAGITDPAIVNALSDFVTNLVNDGLWNKIDVMYPFIGGNQTAHSINLKDPGTYTITSWVGSVSHTNNGVTAVSLSNSSFTVPFSHASQNADNFSAGFYGRFPNGTSSTSNIIYHFNAGTTAMGLDVRSAALSAAWRMCGGSNLTNATIGVSAIGSARFIGYSSNSTTTAYSFINQFTQVSNLSKGSSATGTSISVGISNGISDAPWTYSFWYTGKQLTETEMNLLNIRVQVLNQILDTIQGSTRANNYYIDPALDKGTNRFISNIGISNLTSTEITAVNYLITALVANSNNLWGTLTNIYPYVGVNLATNLKELKSYGVSNATSSGTFNVSSLGLEATATASFVQPATAIVINQPLSVGVYVSEDGQSSGTDIGHSGGGTRLAINARTVSNTATGSLGNGTVTANSVTNAKGHYLLAGAGNGTIGNSFSFYKNGILLGSGTTGNTTISGTAYIQGGALGSSMRAQGLAYTVNGSALNAAQIADLETIVQNYVTLLGRQ